MPESDNIRTLSLRAAEAALLAALPHYYDTRERQNIVRLAAEALVGRTHRLLLRNSNDPLTNAQLSTWQRWTQQLAAGEPLQYVIGVAPFLDFELTVGPGVLIPRPETEELALWAQDTLKLHSAPRVLDVGTGSGCLAIALARRREDAHVTGADLSADALAIAAQNGSRLAPQVQWLCFDFLSATETQFAGLQLIVSNPPYIPRGEANDLLPHVRAHEPSLALFAPEADPLAFYRQLAVLAPTWLAPGGAVVMELHAPLAEVTRSLFLTASFQRVELRPDFQGRPRMLRAFRSV